LARRYDRFCRRPAMRETKPGETPFDRDDPHTATSSHPPGQTRNAIGSCNVGTRVVGRSICQTHYNSYAARSPKARGDRRPPWANAQTGLRGCLRRRRVRVPARSTAAPDIGSLCSCIRPFAASSLNSARQLTVIGPSKRRTSLFHAIHDLIPSWMAAQKRTVQSIAAKQFHGGRLVHHASGLH
jgi:hypothetical protein